MEVVNLVRSRRFLRERPIQVGLFDRSRLVCDLICLEPDQQERRQEQAASDTLYVVIEGHGRLRAGTQTEELEAMDAVLVPPGVAHSMLNPGPGQLTVLVAVAPKPARASEVRLPADRPPRREFGEARRGDTDRRAPAFDRRPRSGPPRDYRDRPPARRPADEAPEERPERPARPFARGPAQNRTERPRGARPPFRGRESFDPARRPARPARPSADRPRPGARDADEGRPPSAGRPRATRPRTGEGGPAQGGIRETSPRERSTRRPARPQRPPGPAPAGRSRAGPRGPRRPAPADRPARPGPGRSGPRPSRRRGAP